MRKSALLQGGVGGGASLTKPTLTTNLTTLGAVFTVPGASFSPQITSPPSFFQALQTDGITINDVSNIIEGFIQNGAYYDVVITPLDSALNNVKISVI